MESHDIDHSYSFNQTVLLVIKITGHFHGQFKLKTSEYIDRGSYFH